MSWASQRQFTYLTGALLVVAGLLFVILYPKLHKAPTCTDGKQNGQETGVDCGGGCNLYCKDEVSKPLVLWSRAFPVTGSVYNLLAYVENQNKAASVPDVNYEFRVYDEGGKLIGRREGHTFIPPNQHFAVFEARFDAGTSIPKNTTFEFVGNMNWLKKDPVVQRLPIKIDRVTIGDNTDTPTLTARINNESIYDLPEFDVITILYDENKNAIAVSKTHKDYLKAGTTLPLLFTWPKAFSSVPVVKEIIHQVNPFMVKF